VRAAQAAKSKSDTSLALLHPELPTLHWGKIPAPELQQPTAVQVDKGPPGEVIQQIYPHPPCISISK